MKIQVIGLPGTGKTTYLDRYLCSRGNLGLAKIPYLDIAFFESEREFTTAVRKGHHTLIAESACGIIIPRSTVVELTVPEEVLVRNLQIRNEPYDRDYWSLLATRKQRADYKCSEYQELAQILDRLLEG